MLLLLLVVAPSLLIFASSSSRSSWSCGLPNNGGFSRCRLSQPAESSVRVVVVLSLCFLTPTAADCCTSQHQGFFHCTVHFTRRQRARESYKITSPSLCASTKRTQIGRISTVCVQHNTNSLPDTPGSIRKDQETKRHDKAEALCCWLRRRHIKNL